MDEPTIPAPAPDAEASGGALSELLRDQTKRRRFLQMVGGAGAAGAFATLVSACGGGESTGTFLKSASASGPSDQQIVNYALTLEYLEATFYDEVTRSGLFSGQKADYFKSFGQEEQTHAAALKALAHKLGHAVSKPSFRFGPMDDARKVLALTAKLENIGASAYLGAAPLIHSQEILASALTIHTVEARHAAVLNTLAGKSATPTGAFAVPRGMAKVLKLVKPFIVSA
jgi:hypothetical protein